MKLDMQTKYHIIYLLESKLSIKLISIKGNILCFANIAGNILDILDEACIIISDYLDSLREPFSIIGDGNHKIVFNDNKLGIFVNYFNC